MEYSQEFKTSESECVYKQNINQLAYSHNAIQKGLRDRSNFTFKIKQRNFKTTVNKNYYYMAMFHKDWELPNLRIWLAEMVLKAV